jgi:hypothetical protein
MKQTINITDSNNILHIVNDHESALEIMQLKDEKAINELIVLSGGFLLKVNRPFTNECYFGSYEDIVEFFREDEEFFRDEENPRAVLNLKEYNEVDGFPVETVYF